MMATKTQGKKRVLAALMALVMTLSLLPVNILAAETVTVGVGETVTLPGITESENGENEWSVEDPGVASVADGRVTGLTAGSPA